MIRNGANTSTSNTIAVEETVAKPIAAGRLIPLLERWSAPFPGYFLCYPQQRQMAPALRAFIDAVRGGAIAPASNEARSGVVGAVADRAGRAHRARLQGRVDPNAICLSYDFSRREGEKEPLGKVGCPLVSGEGRIGSSLTV